MGNELIVSGINNLIPSLASNATQAAAKSATPALASAAAKSFAKAAAPSIAETVAGASVQPLNNLLGNGNLSQLRDAYEGYKGFKTENIGNYDLFGDETNHRDPLAIAQTGYDYQLKQTLGRDYEPTMAKIKQYAAISNPQDYNRAKVDLTSFLQSPESDSVVNASRELVPAGTKVWRAPNSRGGISYSLTKEGAQSAFNGQPGKVMPYTVKDTDRIIAPEFMERGNTGVPQEEIVIVPGIQKYLQ